MAVKPLRCARSFAVGRQVVRKGDIYRSDDPIVKGREEFFVDVLDELGIEQATKNPGQKRAAKKPKTDED